MRNTDQRYYFLSTSYPASMYDLRNTRDTLITTFYGTSAHHAIMDAQVWLDEHPGVNAVLVAPLKAGLSH